MKFSLPSALGLLLISAPAFASSTPGEATLYRDTWGVPYIYAATDADAAYALGYAQAEDRLADLFVNVRTAVGLMSETFGDSFIDQDYAMRISKVAERSEAYWPEAPDHIKTIADSFTRGVQTYIDEHPEKLPDWSLELKPWHSFAIGQAMILNWPLGQIQDELNNTRNAKDLGSNQWSVAPKRSADGVPILLTDPHLTWEGMAVFYEANVHGKDIEMHGFFMVGSPLLALGHNGHVGWAATTGGPDTADVYELKLNPNNALQYNHEGEWKNARLETITIPVKGKEPVKRPAGFTELGPLFSEPDYKNHIAYAGKTPYFETEGLVEQFYAMCAAKDTKQFYRALSMNQYMEQNIMYAGRDGNIGYVRVGRVPTRNTEFDWLKAVSAEDPKTRWRAIHPIADLVQIINPAQGYMQNCNISPANMMKDSPLTPDKYPAYIFNVSWDGNNTRGRRALAMLDADDSVTKEDAMAVAFDVHDILAKPWQTALQQAIDAVNLPVESEAPFKAALDRLLAWDGEFTPDSKAAALVMYWRRAAEPNVDEGVIAKGEGLASAEQEKLVTAVSEAVAKMKEIYGENDVTWGDIHQVGRGGKLFPVGGAVMGSGDDHTRTLFNVGAREQEKGSGVYIANNGSMSMVLMFFHKDGVEAYTCIPWGQSADPASAHHVDQAEKLYSQRKFKQVWPTEAALADHVESKRVLKIM